jgi:hypothetical protein
LPLVDFVAGLAGVVVLSVGFCTGLSLPFSVDEVFPAGVEVPFVEEARGRVGKSVVEGAGVGSLDVSLDENMRVRRFFTDVVGFRCVSDEGFPLIAVAPFCGVRPGDFLTPS